MTVRLSIHYSEHDPILPQTRTRRIQQNTRTNTYEHTDTNIQIQNTKLQRNKTENVEQVIKIYNPKDVLKE